MSAIATHCARSRDDDSRLERGVPYSRALALIPVFLALIAPASVRGDIYKWTDERGNTVVSNVRPVNPDRAREMELLVKEAKPSAQAPAPVSQPRPAEQALQARIDDLERQVQAQQDALEAQAVAQQAIAQASDSSAYYPTPPPPAPAYTSSFDAGYTNPWPPAYSTIVVPAPVFVATPVFVHRRVNRPLHRPGFVNKPGFANRPAFIARPAIGYPHGGAFRSGWVRRGTR
ncbi:MAG: DUF4124 domain-containing protein [Betaproteobacteria bacterium]|nr:DUF4124 domain-containing protein [Betaproteobacteria bacterium]